MTADAAESLPYIDDTFTSDISQFQANAIPDWVKTQYKIAKESLDTTVGKAKFETGIESLVVTGAWGSSVFMNSFGAKKMSTSTYTSFQIGFSGDNQGITDAEWLYRDSDRLMSYQEIWTQECLQKLEDKIQPGIVTFAPGTYPVALDPSLAGECIGEMLGFLSGYAIVEQMSPFSKTEIGSEIFPKWVTIASFHALPGASGAQFFDGNGITTKDITPIQNGILKELFLSKASAERLQLIPNGQPGPINVRLSGIPTKTDLVGVRFLFTSLAGMHTIDSATGNFALE